MSLEGIRVLLYDPPSALTWTRLWSALIKLSPRMLEGVALPYVHSQLSRWPGGLRYVQPKVRAAMLGDAEAYEKLKPSVRLVLPLADHLRMYSDCVGSADLIALSTSEHVSGLTHLTFTLGRETSHEALVIFGGSSRLTRLESLSMGGANLNKEVGEAIVGGPWFRGLKHLSLTAVSFEGSLAAKIDMPKLETLTVTNGDVSPLARAVVSAQSLGLLVMEEMYGSASCALEVLLSRAPRLERLVLNRWMREDPLLVVSSTPSLRGHLESISLSHHLEWGGLNNFAQGDPWERLRAVKIKAERLEERLVRAVCGSVAMPALEALSFSFAEVGDCVVDALTSSAVARSLRSLGLRGTSLTPWDLAALLQCESFEGLEELDLRSNNSLGAKGMRLLGQPHRLGGLERLKLNGSLVTDKIVDAIEANASFGALSSLNVFPCAQSVQGIFGHLVSGGVEKRHDSLLAFLDTLNRAELLKVLKEEGVSIPSRERVKDNLVRSLGSVLLEDPRDVARFLLHEAVLGNFSTKALKATVKRAGGQGYSKLHREALRKRVVELLGVDGSGLLSG